MSLIEVARFIDDPYNPSVVIHYYVDPEEGDYFKLLKQGKKGQVIYFPSLEDLLLEVSRDFQERRVTRYLGGGRTYSPSFLFVHYGEVEGLNPFREVRALISFEPYILNAEEFIPKGLLNISFKEDPLSVASIAQALVEDDFASLKKLLRELMDKNPKAVNLSAWERLKREYYEGLCREIFNSFNR
jgi:hypothetical protein